MITLKNSKIETLYGVLMQVDKNSKDLDFSVRFKNKKNFKLLKESSETFIETINEIYTKFGKEEVKNGKKIFNFIYEEDGKEVNNVDIVKEEVDKLYTLEVEIDLKAIKIYCKEDLKTGKTDTKGLIVTAAEMEILEPIFDFEFISE